MGETEHWMSKSLVQQEIGCSYKHVVSLLISLASLLLTDPSTGAFVRSEHEINIFLQCTIFPFTRSFKSALILSSLADNDSGSFWLATTGVVTEHTSKPHVVSSKYLFFVNLIVLACLAFQETQSDIWRYTLPFCSCISSVSRVKVKDSS